MCKKTILVDVDDTIEDLLPAWVNYLNKKYGLSVKVDDCFDWDMHKLFPMLEKKQIHGALCEQELWDTVIPKQDAIFYLQRLLKEGYEIFLVTSTYYTNVKIKIEYIQKHFPFIDLDNIIICHKKQMVRGDILVDDYIRNLVNGEYQGIMFSTYHNRGTELKDTKIMRANNWGEVYNLIHLMVKFFKGVDKYLNIYYNNCKLNNNLLKTWG